MTAEPMQRWPIETIITDLRAVYEDSFDLKNCWKEEEIGLRDALPGLRDKLDHRYAYALSLGVGGSGVVLRLKDDAFADQDIALKFPRPVTGRADLLRSLLDSDQHPDVLEDTPRFLEDAPEDDDLWFEQKPPKDFDLD